MRYQAVLFDLDGTLLDTLADLAGSANRALRSLELPVHPEDRYRYFVGDGLMTLVERILPPKRRDADTARELARRFLEDYADNWHVRSRPYPGVEAMLADLAARGVTLAVLSNKPHDFTKLCVQELLGDHDFALVLGQRDGVPKKPDPAGALEAAERLGLDPADFLYLGDTATDMRTARAANMTAVGALWGFRDRDELVAAGADHLVARPGDLVDLIVSDQGHRIFARSRLAS